MNLLRFVIFKILSIRIYIFILIGIRLKYSGHKSSQMDDNQILIKNVMIKIIY